LEKGKGRFFQLHASGIARSLKGQKQTQSTANIRASLDLLVRDLMLALFLAGKSSYFGLNFKPREETA
jgi:hypothetical protein